jgi:hypothetical protein
MAHDGVHPRPNEAGQEADPTFYDFFCDSSAPLDGQEEAEQEPRDPRDPPFYNLFSPDSQNPKKNGDW